MEFGTKLIEVIQRTPNIKSFRFFKPDDATFKPGQIFNLSFEIDGEEMRKHFSFSNSPTEEGYIEFTKRITDSSFSSCLNRLKRGDAVRIMMPFGLFSFEGEHDKIAFLTGGIGITAARSICRYAVDKELPTDMVLIYSNKRVWDIAFYDEFNEMERSHERLRVVYTLTSPLEIGESWEGRFGRINREMIEEEIPDHEERVFYLSGPPTMVDALGAILMEEMGLPEERVHMERYMGYR